MSKYIRYEVIAPSGKTTGIFTSDYSLLTLEENLKIRPLSPEYDRLIQAWRDKYSWIKDPEMPGEYWFTPEGDRLFQQLTLPILSKALPQGSQVVRVEIEAKDIPIYEDEHQAAFKVKQVEPFYLASML